MSDLFHKGVHEQFLEAVFDVMARASQHRFQILTKRPGRMASMVRRVRPDPLPNVWLGTSVGDQRWADIRIPKLLQTPAAVRFLSCEPLLAPVDLSPWMSRLAGEKDPALHWMIVGGESGARARPMHPVWARSLRDQCLRAGVPFFFKQWGGRTPKAGGRELDGRTWDEMPQASDARVPAFT